MSGPTRKPRASRPPVPPGLVVVDKESGMTSHDVVAVARRILGTRKIGHAGTLDPMATGVLVLGVERATKLLGHLALDTKAYLATIRLGSATTTDDAEGAVLSTADASGIGESDVRAAIAPLVGDIQQRPSAVSAVKVDGKRAYARVRAGEEVELPPRPVTVARFDVLAQRTEGEYVDLDVLVECSSGTYVRALARDLGASLGVGGHLAALRRTRVGPFGIGAAKTLARLEEKPELSLGLADAVAAAFPRRDLDHAEASALAHGGRLPLAGITGAYGAFDPAGRLIALVSEKNGQATSLVVFAPAGAAADAR
ncbi:tRNA pseudouridine(55) synthase TruB [Actinoalloteichus hoggarensis]|uniref:tRNA pseudouridine synthase B n=1 Tax=Actinoalloteichus hoggarensis TaxID=1470176 RepID=A0A221W0T8_9PSEU|nr:tRNA pseudouridine(55) synthase TruB [Actinoalloteichus hoggarensis]ASO19396.1 tRNA pseudouridine synthase B [Actinoalloteichus hoggarensis]